VYSFISTGPGEIGWDNRYRYTSHALRFDINGAGESESEYLSCINQQAGEEGGQPTTSGYTQSRLTGAARNVGSIRSDRWRGRAADLATADLVAVYPAVGWWRERTNQQRWNKHCRYSLVISIEIDAQSLDIYTPVAVQIAVPTQITLG
jgi:hypothetical protein